MKYRYNQGSGWIFGISWIVFCISFMVAIVWGWVLNIIHLVNMDMVLTGEGIVRIIGVFMVPLGTIMGFFF